MLDLDLLEDESDYGLLPEPHELSMKDIAIVGMSAKLPLADSIDQFWSNLAKAVDCVSAYPESRKRDVEGFLPYVNIQGDSVRYHDGAYLEGIDQFDCRFFRISPAEASLMNPSQRLFLESAWSAVEDAGYGGSKLAGSRTGVFIGYNGDAFYDYKRLIAETAPELLSLAIPGNLSSIVASRISYLLDLKGPALSVDTACSSSLVAVHLACQSLQRGECEAALAGGVKIYTLPIDNGVRIGIESSDSRARTFDDASDGTGGGEGSAVVMLKPLSKALLDRDHVYAVIRGSAVNQDGSSIGITAPNAAAQEEVIVRAWEDAGVDPSTIGVIEAHGTGTKLGDPIELDGIVRAFRRYTDHRQFCAIGSVKSNIGHLDNAAGIAGLIKAVLCLKHKKLAPTLHVERPNAAIDFIESPVYVNERLRDWPASEMPRLAGVSAFGMSGTNCHVVLEEAPASALPERRPEDEVRPDGLPHVLTLSAKSWAALAEYAAQAERFALSTAADQARMQDICYTANTGRGSYRYRAAVLFRNRDELAIKLAALAAALRGGEIAAHGLAPGICAGDAGSDTGKGDALEPNPDCDAAGLSTLCESYADGAAVRWERLYAGEAHWRVRFPTYPFERTRCWLRMPEPYARAVAATAATVGVVSGSSPVPMASVTLEGRDSGDYTAAERLAADCWGSVLGFDRLHLEDNYYQLGGDSIQALQIVNSVNERLGTDPARLGVADLLRAPRLADFARVLASLGGERDAAAPDPASCAAPAAPGVPGAPASETDATDVTDAFRGAREYVPLSASQLRIYIQEQLDGIGEGYHIPFFLIAEGELDLGRFRSAFLELIDRHETFRTSFMMDDGEPVQVVHARVDWDLETIESDGGADRLEERARAFIRPFDLETAPLLRVGLLRLDERQHAILIDMHHLIADGVSTAILVEEFIRLYRGERLTAPRMQYREYVQRQRELAVSEAYETERRYWHGQLTGNRPTAPLPTDRARLNRRTYEGDTLSFKIDGTTADRLQRLASRQQVTLNALLFSAYSAVLSEYCGARELVIGSLVSGRNRAEWQRVMGVCMNFLPIRVNVDPGLETESFVQSVNRALLDAYAHQNVPFNELAAMADRPANASRNPLYDTMFILHNHFNGQEASRFAADGLAFREFKVHAPYAPVDFKLDLFVDPDGGYTGCLNYNVRLFHSETMLRLIDRFNAVLAGFLSEQGKPIGELAMPWPDRRSSAGEPIRVAIASTFTAEPVGPYIGWWLEQFGRSASIQFAGYNQVFQELLNPDSLLAGNAGANVLLVRFEDWLRDDSSDDAAKLAKLERGFLELSEALRQQPASCYVAVLPIQEGGPAEVSERIHRELAGLNDRWAKALAEMPHVHAVDCRALAKQYAIRDCYDPIKDEAGHLPYTDEYYAALGTRIARSIIAAERRPFKVIALDCDNTLWRGVCGEDGALGVIIDESCLALQRRMIDMSRDGMLLVLASKNNEQDVWEVFERHPGMLLKKEHLAGWAIDWQPKSDNVRRLAEELNVGLDSFVFIDDNAAECADMIANCPEVLTLRLPEQSGGIPSFMEHAWAFDRVRLTEEDRQRTSMYVVERTRREHMRGSSSLADYLQGLQLSMTMRPLLPSDAERAAQLTQRTNQFNLNGVQHTAEELLAIAASPDYRCWTIRVKDRFGDYGLVGALVAKRQAESELVIESYMLSCRVLGRGVEDAILTLLKAYADASGIERLLAVHAVTKRNQPFAEYLRRTGWQNAEPTPASGYSLVALDVNRIHAMAAHIDCAFDEQAGIDEGEAEVLELAAPAVEAGVRSEAHESLLAQVFDRPAVLSSREEPPREEAIESGLGLEHRELRSAAHADEPDAWIDAMLAASGSTELLHRAYWLPLQHRTGTRLLRLPVRTVPQEGKTRPAFEPARDETDAVLASLWEDLLGIPQIGIRDNFFELGGDSLKATSLVSAIHQRMQVKLGLRDVFGSESLSELSDIVRQSSGGAFQSLLPSAAPAYGADGYPASAAQRRMFVLNRLDPEDVSYHMSAAFIIEGALDRDRLQQALNLLIQRHESLRTSLELHEKGMAVQRIRKPCVAAIEDCSAYGQDPLAIIRRFVRPFDLGRAPLLRAGLAALDEANRKHLLVVDMHHIVSDGISMQLLARDWIALYEGKALKAQRLQYKDYAVWQHQFMHSETHKVQERYWLSVLSERGAALELPADRPRPHALDGQGAAVTFRIAEPLYRELKAMAARDKVSLYMVLLTAYYLLLSRLSGQEDIAIGTPVAGRTHAELTDMIGVFVNTLALRIRSDRALTFRQLLSEVKDTALRAFDHQDYPFEELVEKLQVKRDASRNPLFDTMFALQNMDRTAIESDTLTVEPYVWDTGVSKFDLTLTVTEDGEMPDCRLDYRTALFDGETIARWSRHYLHVLAQAVEEPDKPIGLYALLTAEEEEALTQSADTDIAEAEQAIAWAQTTLGACFAEQAKRTPERTAVVCGSQSVTYAELSRMVSHLASRLAAMKVGRGQIVGILADRSIEQIAAILSVLAAGAAYLPLDPEAPDDRIRYMLQDSGAAILLTQPRHAVRQLFEGEMIILDGHLEEALREGPQALPLAPSEPDDLAYILYTSGTTGKPKGVMQRHRSVVSFVHAFFHTVYGLAPDRHYRFAQMAPYYFDASVKPVFGSLLLGHTMVIVPEDTRRDGNMLARFLNEQRIDMTDMTPSLAAMLNQAEDGLRLRTRYWLIGGEALSCRTAAQLLERHEATPELFNVYGPTETCVNSTLHRITDPNASIEDNVRRLLSSTSQHVPIGRPLPWQQAYIVDETGRPVPIGVQGELWIGGHGVAAGYWRLPDLTASRFIDNPFRPGEKLYRTGDLAKRLPDGTIAYLGRIDDQVKIRGNRIELGEIEAKLLRHEAIREAVVAAREDKHGDAYLCAYLVSDRELTIQALRSELARELPDYMVPSHFVRLHRIPTTRSGKADRKSLPEPDGSIASAVPYEEAGDELEAALVSMWLELLETDRIGVHDDFFELGGHSLKAVVLASNVQRRFQIELPLRQLFRTPTVRGLAAWMQSGDRSEWSAIRPVQEQPHYPASSAQRRMYLMQQSDPGSSSYHIPLLLRLTGKLDADRTAGAIRELTARHEALRTMFGMADGKVVQRIDPLYVPVIEWDDASVLGCPPEEAMLRLQSWLDEPFDLSQPPLRVRIARLAEEEHLLLINVHHIVSDGVSTRILVDQFEALYNGDPLPESGIRYIDYANWQQEQLASPAAASQLAYWQARLGDYRGALRFPANQGRFPRLGDEACLQGDGFLIGRIDPELTGRLKRLARQSEATLFMVLLAAYQILLSKFTGQQDIAVGTPVAGRTRTELQSVIGLFVNTLVIRNSPLPELTAQAYLAEVRSACLEAFEHQDVPFDHVLRALPSPIASGRHSLVQAMFVMQNTDVKPPSLLGLRAEGVRPARISAKSDLALQAFENGDGGYELRWEHRGAAIDRSAAEQMASRYIRLLNELAEQPDCAIRALKLLEDDEREKLADVTIARRQLTDTFDF